MFVFVLKTESCKHHLSLMVYVQCEVLHIMSGLLLLHIWFESIVCNLMLFTWQQLAKMLNTMSTGKNWEYLLFTHIQDSAQKTVILNMIMWPYHTLEHL